MAVQSNVHVPDKKAYLTMFELIMKRHLIKLNIGTNIKLRIESISFGYRHFYKIQTEAVRTIFHTTVTCSTNLSAPPGELQNPRFLKRTRIINMFDALCWMKHQEVEDTYLL